MVAAICITGIFIYFFFWSKKLLKEQQREWEQFGQEDERETLQGTITRSLTQKKRFSAHYWYHEIEASLYVEKERQTLKLLWRKPSKPQMEVPQIEKNQRVMVAGNRRQGTFYANQITPLEES